MKGRPKGSRATQPRPNTKHAAIVAAYDSRSPLYTTTASIAEAVGTTSFQVANALTRWRPDWRRRLWPKEALDAWEAEQLAAQVKEMP